MNPQLILTGDHSHTLYHPIWDETYHSKGGAIGESQFVYIDAGLNYMASRKEQVAVFEFGFGTGLNALLTWKYAEAHKKRIHYETVEKFPLSSELYQSLNYGDQLQEQEKFTLLHSQTWDEEIIFSPYFHFEKKAIDIFDWAFPSSFYDVVYFDAFAPSKQSEVWDIELLEKVYHSLQPGGVLVTYCSQGQFKRNLKTIGFHLTLLPGPYNKKEITRAMK